MEKGFKVSDSENASQCAFLLLPESSQRIFPVPFIYLKRGYVQTLHSVADAAKAMVLKADVDPLLLFP